MLLLTFRDLVFRRTRFLVVVVLGAVVFALLFVMTGLVEQFNREPLDTVDAIGADNWVVPEGVSGPFTALSAAPVAWTDQVTASNTDAAVISRSSLSTAADATAVAIMLVGHEVGGLGSPPTVDGRAAAAPGEVAADETLGLSVGQSVTIVGQPFTVVGETRRTTALAGVPLAFVVLSDAQQLIFSSRDVISAVLVDGEPSAIPPGAKTMTDDEVAANLTEPLEGAISSIDLVRALLWIVAAIVVGAVVYLSALERQRDFAVLKAVGAPDRALLGSLALQAVLVALLAVGLGAVIQVFLAPRFPLVVIVPARAFWQLPVFAVVMALAAGIVGMRKVLRADPSQAFAGAGT
jgi:putative ABC transport system permease protein